MTKPFVYKCTLDRVDDEDPVYVNIYLGFKIVLAKQRVRLVGIDPPEPKNRTLHKHTMGPQTQELCKK